MSFCLVRAQRWMQRDTRGVYAGLAALHGTWACLPANHASMLVSALVPLLPTGVLALLVEAGEAPETVAAAGEEWLASHRRDPRARDVALSTALAHRSVAEDLAKKQVRQGTAVCGCKRGCASISAWLQALCLGSARCELQLRQAATHEPAARIIPPCPLDPHPCRATPWLQPACWRWRPRCCGSTGWPRSCRAIWRPTPRRCSLRWPASWWRCRWSGLPSGSAACRCMHGAALGLRPCWDVAWWCMVWACQGGACGSLHLLHPHPNSAPLSFPCFPGIGGGAD